MTGTGQHVDVSKQEASLGLDRAEVTLYTAQGMLSSRVRLGGAIGFLPARDGYVLVMSGDDRSWKALTELMGNPEWTKDEKFKDRESREINGRELNSLIAEWTKTVDGDEIYHKVQAGGIPSGVVRSQGELMEDDEQLKARGFFVEVEHPEAGGLSYPSAPYRLSETPWTVERPAPTLGEHNEAVYSGLLGYSKEELVKLREAGII